MASTPKPFARFEWMIAWRYLRAKRAEGGVSVMTWISLIGITLAVFALVATLAIRTGLRAETIRTILGVSAHVELYYHQTVAANGARETIIRDFEPLADRLRAVPGVKDAVPVVTGRIMANRGSNNAPIELVGIRPEDLARFPAVAQPSFSEGDIGRLPEGIALGSSLARTLSVLVGDRVKIISPSGVRTAFGTSPRVKTWEVVYIFRTGQGWIDATRAYLSLAEAQPYLNREEGVDQIDILLDDPEAVEDMSGALLEASENEAYLWNWRQRSGAQLRALSLQDNALFVLLAILVMIATMNIISGLIMLVKNKGRDIGILRTVGLSRGSILRVFFIVGTTIGVMGTILGVGMGVLFALNIDHVYTAVDYFSSNSKSQLEAQGFFFPPAVLSVSDILTAIGLSLGLSFLVTIFPARRAARMNPVEALRYE
ncbi:MAG: FtsX-like permease family protein [Pseudomonadota bacterium]